MRDVDTIISGGRILTLDGGDSIIRDGSLAISGNRIAGIGTAEEMAARFSGHTTIDARDCLVMPGLVNGHTHAAMTCFRGLADDMELMDWLNNYIFPAEARNVDPELAYWGSVLACAEMIQSGTTTFCDMYLFEDETARAASEAGMRCLLGEGIFDFPSPSTKTPEEGLAYTRMLIEKWADDPLVNIVVEPHSLYTCSPPVIRKAKKLADEYGLPFAIHFLENRGEVQQLTERFGMKATRFLEELGCLDERFFAFHCVCMDEEDMRIFADHGCKVV
ncbi:MAG: amidohydrolase family protein, partial [Deltaproteobacteria bacterium]|nr:amidohydrolase family protein [Deltaproteobacteria bacterium]